MNRPPFSTRVLLIFVAAGSCIGFDSTIPAARAAGYGSCGCNRFGGYNYRRSSHVYRPSRYSAVRYSFYRQPFGSYHPRSLTGRYGYRSAYGFAHGGYRSSVISHGRFGGYFPYRTSTSLIRYGRTFGYQRGSAFPRYRVHFGQSVIPALPDSNVAENQFVSLKTNSFSIPTDEGWIRLSEGSAAHAVAAFDRRISENPGNMLAKVGLALSFASAGDLTAGAWHMRQACSSDVNVLRLVLLDDELNHQIVHLIGDYQKSLSKRSAGRQSLFMLAALNYLNGDKKAASTAIANAIRNGDRTAAARRLQELIKNPDVDRRPALAQN